MTGHVATFHATEPETHLPTQQLPEPADPFSKWLGGAAAAIWAVGVQSAYPSLRAPLAILTPGVGFIAGHGFAILLKHYEEGAALRQRNRKRDLEVSKIKLNIKEIKETILVARRHGAPQDRINEYESMLSNAHKQLEITMIS